MLTDKFIAAVRKKRQGMEREAYAPRAQSWEQYLEQAGRYAALTELEGELEKLLNQEES